MRWRALDDNDLTATLSKSEVEAFRRDGTSSVARLRVRTTAHVRGCIAASGRCRRPGPEGTLPESLVSPACDYWAADLLKRMDIPMNEDRRKARERAEALFERVAKGEYVPESDEAEETTASGGPAIEVVATVRERVSAAKLEGL